MKGPTSACLGVLGALLLVACVEPTVGPTTAAKRTHERPFEFKTVTSKDAPRSTRRAGSVDLFSGGPVTFLEGWAPSPDAKLLVVSVLPLEVIDNYRLHRPDAATAIGVVGRDDLGFRVTLRVLGGSIDKVCVLSQDPGGEVSLLAGSDPGLCVSP